MLEIFSQFIAFYFINGIFHRTDIFNFYGIEILNPPL